MSEFVPFGSADYWILSVLLLLGRGADMFSTWLATPNLVLEGNPIARRLGWRMGLPINLLLCFAFAFSPLPAVMVATSSFLVTTHNLHVGWMMRTMGEEAYRDFHVSCMHRTSAGMFVGGVLGRGLIHILLGVGVGIYSQTVVPLGIGFGLAAYGLILIFYTLLAFWRIRRN